MKRKILWLIVSCLMVLSLVMASCAPAVVEEEKEVVKEEVEKEVEKEVVAPTVEKPKYGGVLKVALNADITDFDEIVGSTTATRTMWVTNEMLCSGDWTKGPAGGYGTNETEWAALNDVWKLRAGYIAESWEIPNKIEGEVGTLIYHIRQGVHWALNPDSEASRLVGGREVTVDDVVFSLTQAITDPRAYLYKSDPEIRRAKITSPAPWTVKVEFPWETFELVISRFGGSLSIVPPEVCEKYGTMRDWKVSVGTGPFMLTDFVPGSTATFVRNPNYWMKDPIGPGKGNQLPYMDGVKYFIILDQSTMYAALRTARIDWIGPEMSGNIHYKEEATSLLKTAPQLMSALSPNPRGSSACVLKIHNPPFNDIRVRRALFMAIDFEAIKRDYYVGDAQIVSLPINYMKEYAAAYYGPDEQGQWPSDCPESTKELYIYNPEKAKALLAEAGYPKGFKTNMIISSKVDIIDYYSVIKDYWSKVGIDVELRSKETAALATIQNNKTFDQMLLSTGFMIVNLYKLHYWQGVTLRNMADIDDPVVNEVFPKIQEVLVTSEAEANRLHKELMKYILDQAWVIPKVTPNLYVLWWPWLKNYSGEVSVGYFHRHAYNWVWIDEALKKSMGY